MKIELSDEAKQYLVSSGYSPAYGARPLNRAIQQELLNPLSVMILSERVRDGETVHVQFDGPHNRLHIVPNHEGTGDGMDVDYYDDDDDGDMDDMYNFIEEDEEEGGGAMDEQEREARRRERRRLEKIRRKALGSRPELTGIDARYVPYQST